jgi:hypothetical protein
MVSLTKLRFLSDMKASLSGISIFCAPNSAFIFGILYFCYLYESVFAIEDLLMPWQTGGGRATGFALKQFAVAIPGRGLSQSRTGGRAVNLSIGILIGK